ncbi:MAG: ProQ/FINO family protein [Candidatus Competibacterales bacterium]
MSLAGESLALGGAVQPPAPSPRALARQLATRLEQTYPNAIFPLSARRVKPLKLGIHKDLMPTVRDWGYPAAALKIFLSHYTGMMRYQVALTKEPVRVDLQGERAGEVSDDNRQMAQTQIVQLKARRRQRAEAAAPGEKPVEGEVGGGGEAAGSEAAAGTAPDASAPRPRPAKPRRRRPPRSAAPAAEGSGETVAATPPGEGGEKTAAEGNNPPLQQVSPRAQRPRGEHPRGERPPRRGDGRRGDGRRGPEGRGTANTPPQQDEAAAAAKAFDAEAANRPARPLGQLDDSILAELQAKLTRKAMR